MRRYEEEEERKRGRERGRGLVGLICQPGHQRDTMKPAADINGHDGTVVKVAIVCRKKNEKYFFMSVP